MTQTLTEACIINMICPSSIFTVCSILFRLLKNLVHGRTRRKNLIWCILPTNRRQKIGCAYCYTIFQEGKESKSFEFSPSGQTLPDRCFQLRQCGRGILQSDGVFDPDSYDLLNHIGAWDTKTCSKSNQVYVNHFIFCAVSACTQHFVP